MNPINERKEMKRLILTSLFFLCIVSMFGCSNAYMSMQGGYPSAVTPAFVFSDDVVYPFKDSFTNFTLERKDYRILGHVTTEMESINILYIYSRGDCGYGKLLEIAKQKYPQANALMNVYWDSKLTHVGWPYPPLPLFQKVTARVTATAISLR